VRQRLDPGEREAASAALDGVKGAKDVAQDLGRRRRAGRLGRRGRLLELDQLPVQAVQVLATLAEEFRQDVVHVSVTVAPAPAGSPVQVETRRKRAGSVANSRVAANRSLQGRGE